MKILKILLPSFITGAGIAAVHFTHLDKKSLMPSTPGAPYAVIDRYIEDQVRRLSVPGLSMAIVEGTRIVHVRGFGHARPGGEKPTPLTPFFIGSVTKSFTALAIMQLVEAGKLELDAPVQRYLPWFRVHDPEASARMTIRNLLNHTSGIGMSTGEIGLADFDDCPDATERQVRALSNIKPGNPVGAKFNYNNTNYNILGLIIESASGESYAAYIQNHIFNPLEMRHSYTSRGPAQKNNLAVGYRYWFGYPIPAPNLSIPLGSLPSGQLISCAEDMAHYLIAHLNGGKYNGTQILSKAGIEEMFHPSARIREMGREIGYYALGWICTTTGSSQIISHSGIVPEYGAFAGLIPEQQKGIILLYNANHAMIKMTFDELGMGATERLAGETPSKTMFGIAPLLMRGMVLIPVLQLAGVLQTLRRLATWRSNPASRPSQTSLWGRHILLPLVPNMLATLMLVPMMSKMRGWLRLFMADFSWIAWISGSFAALWAFVRTVLVLRAVRHKR